MLKTVAMDQGYAKLGAAGMRMEGEATAEVGR
jgi:hypothetical protein